MKTKEKEEFGLYINDKFLGIGNLLKVSSEIKKHLPKFKNSHIAGVYYHVSNMTGINNSGVKKL